MRKATTGITSQVLLIATIANTTAQPFPFKNKRENDSYAHLSVLCREAGMELFIAHYANLQDNAQILAWSEVAGQWVCGHYPLSSFTLSYADLPQNFIAANTLRLALQQHAINIVNPLALSDLCTDKLASYKRWPHLLAPTFLLGEIHLSNKIDQIQNCSDLNCTELILKPRFGERGKGIHIINRQALDSLDSSSYKDYIVQPLINTQTGIPALGINGRHDLRLIMAQGKVVQVYARIPPVDSWISNTAHGGTIHYYEPNVLPVRILNFAEAIDEELSHFSPRVYSIDIGIAPSGRIWVYELNTMPGIVWNASCQSDIQKNKEMHQVITDVMYTALYAGTSNPDRHREKIMSGSSQVRSEK